MVLSLASDPGFAQTPPASQVPPQNDESQIVVVGSRTIIAALQDLAVEQEYDQARSASYGASTVGELLDAIAGENGDDGPKILVNGRPVSDPGDIADYPVEAIAKIEALPRGAAARIGGAVGQRAYNVILKRSVKTLTVTAARQVATEGGWGLSRGEGIATYVSGQDRINLSLRGSDSSALLERDRTFTTLAQSAPYAPLGNIVALAGGEVDPMFSAAAGRPVTSIGLPRGVARPTLASLLPYADQLNPSNLADFRTLRGAATNWDASLAANKQLTKWLSLAANGRLNWSNYDGLSGLPSGRFTVPVGPNSPFSRPVTLLLSDPARPLVNSSDNRGGSGSATLTALLGGFRLTLLGRYDERRRTSAYDTASGSVITLAPAIDPFAAPLVDQIAVTRRSTTSRTVIREVSEELEGPIFKLPAGQVRVRAYLSAARSTLEGVDYLGTPRSFSRRELGYRGSISVPLIAGRGPSGTGQADILLEAGRLDLGRYGRIDRYSAAFNWQVKPWARLSVSRSKDGSPIYPDLLAAPTFVEPNVRYFDPVRNETAFVTLISGGTNTLINESQRIDRIGFNFSPYAKYRTAIGVTYSDTLVRNPIGGLPPPSATIASAFPERFVRDASGALIQVDSRTVNFDSQHVRDLRSTLDMTVALFGAEPASKGLRAIPATTLQLHAGHTWLIEANTIIRAGLPTVDLLSGGAVGIGGGRQRHLLDLSAALMQGQSGFRLSALCRGASLLAIGSIAAPDTLTYQPFTKVDLRGFLDLSTIAPQSHIAKGAKLTVAIENVTGARQNAVVTSGVLPLYYQSIFRDPVGRTVSIELRKVF